MKRHLVVGRFGSADTQPVPSNADEQETPLPLVAGDGTLTHGMGAALAALARRGVYPSELGIDLLVLAAHVHAADTRISRSAQSQDSWTRELRLVVPVSDPGRWRDAAGTIVRMLNFLTGDRWAVAFRARPPAFGFLVNPPATLLPPPFDVVSLFSGGLDSLIGAIDTLHAGGSPLLVSHAGDPVTSAAQQQLYDRLKERYPTARMDRLRVWMRFSGQLVDGVASEISTRGRSFLFFALGVLAGTGLPGGFSLRVPENGLIALNVPLDPLRLGSNSTRTTHPFYIARWNDLLGELGIAGSIQNPYWNQTKGEMVARCANGALLAEVAADSLSCAHPTAGRWAGLGIEQCGHCLPCLIRRASLLAAWNRDPTVYTVADLTAQPLDSNQSTGKQVRAFQVAIERLRARPDIARILIHKPGSLADDPSRLPELADVYRRGLGEVAALLQGVDTRPL